MPGPLQDTISLLNPEFGTHDPDGSIFETWKLRMRRWRQQNASRGRQGNQRRNTPSNHRSRYHNRGQNTTYQTNLPGTARTHVTADARYLPQRPHHAPQTRRAHLLRITPHILYCTGNTIIPHDGSKTVHRLLRYLRHYTMDCSARPIVRGPLLVSVTPDSGDKFIYLKPPTLSLRMDHIRQARRQFRGVGRRNP